MVFPGCCFEQGHKFRRIFLCHSMGSSWILEHLPISHFSIQG